MVVAMRDNERRLRLPALIRFLAGHCALGVTAGLATAGLLLWLDIGGIGGLVAGDGADRWIAVGLLGFGFAITFGSLAMGSALFLLPRDDESDDEPPLLPADQAPVRSAARTRARWKV
jgi:hypothetical protein